MLLFWELECVKSPLAVVMIAQRGVGVSLKQESKMTVLVMVLF